MRNVPAVLVSVPEGTTAYDIQQEASKQHPCFKAVYQTFTGLGRYITTMCCVEQNQAASLYWMIYVDGSQAQYGVDQLKPNDGQFLSFRYQEVIF